MSTLLQLEEKKELFEKIRSGQGFATFIGSGRIDEYGFSNTVFRIGSRLLALKNNVNTGEFALDQDTFWIEENEVM